MLLNSSTCKSNWLSLKLYLSFSHLLVECVKLSAELDLKTDVVNNEGGIVTEQSLNFLSLKQTLKKGGHQSDR